MKDKKKRATGKREILLVSVILFMALLISMVSRSINNGDSSAVIISVDGKTVNTFPLDTDQEYLIRGIGDGTNRLVIKNREAWISEASCPDRICVHQGKISQEGEMIVCLPNRMIAKIASTPPAP